MKLLVIILTVLFFANALAMQNIDPYFETKFKMAQMKNPKVAQELGRYRYGTFFWGSLGVISAGIWLGIKLEYIPIDSKKILHVFALGAFGGGVISLRCKRKSDEYLHQLAEIALQISDEQAYTAQDMGWDTYKALQNL